MRWKILYYTEPICFERHRKETILLLRNASLCPCAPNSHVAMCVMSTAVIYIYVFHPDFSSAKLINQNSPRLLLVPSPPPRFFQNTRGIIVAASILRFLFDNVSLSILSSSFILSFIHSFIHSSSCMTPLPSLIFIFCLFGYQLLPFASAHDITLIRYPSTLHPSLLHDSVQISTARNRQISFLSTQL